MDLVKKGASVFFFPEGTRSKDGRLGTFKVSCILEISAASIEKHNTISIPFRDSGHVDCGMIYLHLDR